MQTSNSDWIREAGKMGDVYSNSYCNIAASDAEDSLGTLFFRRDTSTILPEEINFEWHPKGPRTFLLYETECEEPLSTRPLHKRGWVLQEQLLAPRTLVFTKDQIRWECRFHEASETFPGGVPVSLNGEDLLQDSVPPRPRHLLKSMIVSAAPVYSSYDRSDYNKSPLHCFWLNWKEIVEEYTNRHLTVGSDKLTAIAGIASLLDRLFEVEGEPISNYIAGMWNVRFFTEYELCWTVGNQPNGNPSRRPICYRAPSWSWASVDGKITYHYKRNYDRTGDTQLAFVEDAKVVTVDGSATGPVESGWIKIRGPLMEYENGAYAPDDESLPHPGKSTG
ncbi:hypothetical protein DL765_005300 [Monosporascus sp. GIB2]|nr:hypothetical protein DL765_005300 [Monosporascus sp. GIB2]